MPARPSKADFPFRDGSDPRVLYVLSQRAKAFPKAREFAQQQRDWIDVQLEALPPPQPFIPGKEILFQGQYFQLENPSGRGRARVNRVGRKIIVPCENCKALA